MRRILAALALVAGAGAAQAQTTVSGPITFGTVFSVSGAGTVSIAPGGIAGTMLASGIALPSATLSGTTTLPGSGQITSAGALGLGAAPTSMLSVNANSVGATAASVTGGGVVANLIGANAASARLLIDGFGGPAVILGRRADGTYAAPSALVAGDVMLNFNAFGYGATGYSSGARAAMQYLADENWSDTSQGARIAFLTTANGTTAAPTERLRIANNGFVGIGGIAPNYLLQIDGGASNAAVVQFTNSTTGGTAGDGAYIGLLSGGSDLWIDNQESGAVKILAAGIEQARWDGGGGFYLANLPATPGGKQPMCIDATSKQVYRGSAGAC